MRISFYQIDRLYARHRKRIQKITSDVFSSGQVVEGPAVAELEERLKNICKRKHAITLNSCTDALYFSLRAAGIGKGDEVIVPALSFVASASPVIRAGASVVFADVMHDGNIDLNDASRKVSRKTKAIIPVHLYGKMVSPGDLKTFAKNHSLLLIEDAAQAIGSRFGKISAGSTGFCSCFSFDPSKIVGAFGTGGAVLCDDDFVAGQIRMWRGQGRETSGSQFVQPGFNSRLSTLQAALINMQLEELDDIIASRNAVAEKFRNAFLSLPLGLPEPSTNKSICNFHKYPVITSLRDGLKKYLAEQGIETAVHYPYLLPGQPVFGKSTGKFPKAASVSAATLSLPIYPEMTDKETDFICRSVERFFKKK